MTRVTQDTAVTSASPLSTIFLGSLHLCAEPLVYFGRVPSSFIDAILLCHRACLKILISLYMLCHCLLEVCSLLLFYFTGDRG